MADVSSINGYSLKDKTARELIETNTVEIESLKNADNTNFVSKVPVSGDITYTADTVETYGIETADGFYNLQGEFVASTSEQKYTSWKLPVTANTVIEQQMSSLLGMYKVYVDVNGTFISSYTPDNQTSYDVPVSFTVPDNADIAYMWTSFGNDDYVNEDQPAVIVVHSASETELYKYVLNSAIEIPQLESELESVNEKINDIEEQLATTKWKGKKVNFLGDSITEGYSTTKIYHEYLVEMLGITVVNYGIGSSTIADGSDPMYERALTMDEDADLVCVFGGTNDFGIHDRALGEQFNTADDGTLTLNTDTTTFYGGLNQLLINLYDRYPNKTLCIFTPLRRGAFYTQNTDLQPNAEGKYFYEYIEAIKNVCAWFSVKCIDLYAESGLYPHNSTNATMYFNEDDLIHPNASGHLQIAKVLCEYIKNLPIKE